MLQRLALACPTTMAVASGHAFAQSPSPNGVRTLDPLVARSLRFAEGRLS
jgi:hypothetical protein